MPEYDTSTERRINDEQPSNSDPPFTDDDGGDTAESEDTVNDSSDHLSDLEDGAGCTEIWEKLSEQRDGSR